MPLDPRAQRVNELIAELEAQVAPLADPIEGFDDIASLDVRPDTRAAALERKTLLQQRIELITNAIFALKTLMGGGYPTLPEVSLDPAILADIAEQVRTIQSASALLLPQGASALRSSVMGVAKGAAPFPPA